MDLFTIKDLENLSGIKAHTLRIWEQRYSFLKPNRTFTNIRHYNNEELKTVLNIALLNKYGYKISHIDKMSAVDIREKILSLSASEAQQERIVHELIECMVDLDMDAFEDIIDKFISSRGIERSINQVIFPFLEKIGILWMTNHMNPAQEHLVSNIIRQKLIIGIEAVRPSIVVNKSVLMFLPEGEYHELGLLFMYFLLKSRGLNIIYLGANIPIEDAEYIVKLKQPEFLYCHLATVGQTFNFDRFINKLSKHFPKKNIILSGILGNAYEKKIHPPLYYKKTFNEVMECISSAS